MGGMGPGLRREDKETTSLSVKLCKAIFEILH
jgi:hypothetical protein